MLRIREKERRSQEVLEDKKQFSEKTPLFAEPYKVMVWGVGEGKRGGKRVEVGKKSCGSAWGVTDLSINTNTASSHLLNFNSLEYVLESLLVMQEQYGLWVGPL